MGSARLRLPNRYYTIYVNRGTINGEGGYGMDIAINELKQHLFAKVELLRGNLDDNDLKLDCLALIDAINVLEMRAYGRKITDEWGL